jgi:hypothetical protein
MPNQHERLLLSREQVALMNEVLADSPSRIKETAAKVANGEVVPDGDADAVVDALAAAMVATDNLGNELTGRGVEIDGLIGVVAQLSEHFYDWIRQGSFRNTGPGERLTSWLRGTFIRDEIARPSLLVSRDKLGSARARGEIPRSIETRPATGDLTQTGQTVGPGRSEGWLGRRNRSGQVDWAAVAAPLDALDAPPGNARRRCEL